MRFETIMDLKLKNKTILVTGGGKGIGLAIVKRLLESGANVAAHYNISEGELSDLAERHFHLKLFKADLSDSNEALSLIERVESEWRPIDVLVNNAGIAISSDPSGEDESFIEAFYKTLSVNLIAVGVLCKKVIEKFEKRGGGIIINISSRAAFRGDTQDYLAYAASKGGVVSLTRSIARAYGKKGIVAFDVAPGFTKTAMAQQFFDEYGEEFALSNIALNELTEPEDISPMVAFLASGMANHATGTSIDMNAGSYVH